MHTGKTQLTVKGLKSTNPTLLNLGLENRGRGGGGLVVMYGDKMEDKLGGKTINLTL